MMAQHNTGERGGEIVLNVAAVVAGMNPQQQRAIDRGLAVPGGALELEQLLDVFYRLPRDERAAVIAAVRSHAPLRMASASGE